MRGAWGGSPPSLARARDRSEIAYHVARRRRRFCMAASESLAQEAFVRDSRDNIGAVVVALW